jgi:hypothetical protein
MRGFVLQPQCRKIPRKLPCSRQLVPQARKKRSEHHTAGVPTPLPSRNRRPFLQRDIHYWSDSMNGSEFNVVTSSID